ncbi:MAG TPA: response regulator [Aggregatilineales bacterium]|nr:response regulator [Aggregatilineales bacterium]
MPTWMVVEDEPDIYDVLLAMFEIWGIEGVAFVDGAEAVAWIDDVDKGSAAGELPELAILDIRLPELSGPEVGARLRKSPRLGKMAIVMITAYRLTPEEETNIKKQAQADTLMYKPLPAMPELRRILDGIINHRSAPPEAPAHPTPPAVTPPAAKPAPAATPPAPAAPASSSSSSSKPASHSTPPNSGSNASGTPSAKKPTSPLKPPSRSRTSR